MPLAAGSTMIRAVVPKNVAETIARTAKATGKSRSKIVAEFLTEAEPALRRLAGMLEVAKQQQSLFPKSTVAELNAALDDFSGSYEEVMDRINGATQLPLTEPTATRLRRTASSVARSGQRKRSGR